MMPHSILQFALQIQLNKYADPLSTYSPHDISRIQLEMGMIAAYQFSC